MFLIHLPQVWKKGMDEFRSVPVFQRKYKPTGDFLKIYVNEIEDFRIIQRHFTESKINFQKLDLSLLVQKCVVRGLPISTSSDFTMEDLRPKCFKPISVCYLKNRLIKQPMPFFLITYENQPNFAYMYKIFIIN